PTSPNQHESLHGPLWRFAELWPKIISVEEEPNVWKKRLRINFGRRRRFTELPLPVVHESVQKRMGFAPDGQTPAKKGMKRHPSPDKPNHLPGQPQLVADDYRKPVAGATAAKP